MIYHASHYFEPIKRLLLGARRCDVRRASLAAFGRQPSKALSAVCDSEHKICSVVAGARPHSATQDKRGAGPKYRPQVSASLAAPRLLGYPDAGRIAATTTGATASGASVWPHWPCMRAMATTTDVGLHAVHSTALPHARAPQRSAAATHVADATSGKHGAAGTAGMSGMANCGDEWCGSGCGDVRRGGDARVVGNAHWHGSSTWFWRAVWQWR
ncbi:hypothetical protein C8R44DRAFT_754358 [Mycena epipterygia]|nr:hypothetical protein C8R44DRAFT_754358 [Mycena epipterygia]